VRPDLIKIGKISGASGIRGEIKLFHDSGERERIAGIDELFLSRNGRGAEGGVPQRVKILSMRYAGKTPILSVRGIETREGAESLIGAVVYVRKDALAPLDEDSYYVEDLAGLAVVDEGGGLIGEVAGTIDNPAHDILRIVPDGGDEEILLPMVDEFVLSASIGEGRIVVRLPDGIAETATRRRTSAPATRRREPGGVE
jgi:16S rRNA processing protein RimM